MLNQKIDYNYICIMWDTIYIYVCVCVCVLASYLSISVFLYNALSNTHIPTHLQM